MKTDYAKLVAALCLPPGTTVVVWDKDSTLANTLHRQPMIPSIRAGEATWEEYSLACRDDTPIAGAVALMRMLRPVFTQVVVSGSSECARLAAESWAVKHRVPWDRLVLRPDGDHTPNAQFKVAVLRAMKEAGLNVCLLVEDWPEVKTLVEEETGVPVLVVNPCYPPEALHASPAGQVEAG